MHKNIVVCFSGRGSHFKNLIDNQDQSYTIVGAICNNIMAEGIDYAIRHNIPLSVIDRNDDILPFVNLYKPDLVILAGYMKILKGAVLDQYPIINIHPSLLPKYPGLHTHSKVLKNRDAIHGCTVHRVNEFLDAGEILAQATIPVLASDTPDSLASRLLPLEHELYVKVIRELKV